MILFGLLLVEVVIFFFGNLVDVFRFNRLFSYCYVYVDVFLSLNFVFSFSCYLFMLFVLLLQR